MTLSWQDYLSIIGGIGGLCGGYSLIQNRQQTKLAREQTQLMRDQARKAEEEQSEERQWAERHEQLALRLSKINPGLMIADPTANSHMVLYSTVFADPQFRSRIETYIVSTNTGRTEFIPRKPTPHELRSQGLRETVAITEQLITEYCRNNPKVQLMYYLGAAPCV